ncbi:hypothetical protein CVT26_012998 [Gymnopilus dilepis]|uniref:Uncharacterized protein n=1 Tax=Gymnopilus dilepis TaxID=231916 RepID=A0A409YPB3_9AGAR|nr:hypothetical protein CVT26_012998 [Gymnopilus dilepis]
MSPSVVPPRDSDSPPSSSATADPDSLDPSFDGYVAEPAIVLPASFGIFVLFGLFICVICLCGRKKKGCKHYIPNLPKIPQRIMSC